MTMRSDVSVRRGRVASIANEQLMTVKDYSMNTQTGTNTNIALLIGAKIKY